MKITNVKDLKEFLATLPAEADEWEVAFGAKTDGLTFVGKATIGTWSDDTDEVPESCKPGSSFLMLA